MTTEDSFVMTKQGLEMVKTKDEYAFFDDEQLIYSLKEYQCEVHFNQSLKNRFNNAISDQSLGSASTFVSHEFCNEKEFALLSDIKMGNIALEGEGNP